MDDPPRVVTPPTDRQLRALHAGFANLGYRSRSDRADRLTLAAETLGIPQLDSFNDLTAGQTGYLLGMLRRGANFPQPNSARPLGSYPTVGEDNAGQGAEDDASAGAAYSKPELQARTAAAAVLRQQAARQPKARQIAAAADVAAIGAVIIWGTQQIRRHLAQRLALLTGSAAAHTRPG